MTKLKEDILQNKYAIIILVLIFIPMQIFCGTVCPFKALTGFDCPGCGLTHACIYFFTLRFSDAFKANPTFPFWIITIICFIIDRYIHELKFKPFPIMVIITCLITIAYYLYKVLYLKVVF